METNNTPEIRFKGFDAAWEQRKLGDCFEFLKNNTLSRACLNGENGTARNIHYGDILIKFGDCLDGERSDLPFITDDTVLPKFAGSILREGDVIFADTAEDEVAGKCVELRKLPKEPAISGLHTIPARPRFPFGTGYLGHYLNSDAYHRQLLPLMQGIKVISVSKAALQDTQVRFPSLSEQTAIGAVLSEVDNLITLHQSRCDKLVKLKSAMLDKMFPKFGETEPAIRFAGCNDPWKRRRLGEEFQIFGNNTLPRAELSDFRGTILNIHYGDVLVKYGSTLDASSECVPRIADENLAQDLTCDLLRDGDIIVADTAEDETVGKCSELRGLEGLSAVSGLHTIPLRPVREYAPAYLGYYLNSSSYHDQLLPLMQGIKVISISRTALANTEMMVPDFKEQHLVGSYFYRLDSLITLHQRKLEGLRRLKTAMLDKMFV